MPTLSLKSYWGRSSSWFLAHKVWSAIFVAVLLSGGWWAYAQLTSTKGETRYILGTVSSSTIIASISGSGQVSPSNQVDIKPKQSGEIIRVLVKQGDTVREGQALAYIDATSAQKAVRDAEANLESARISLQKLQQPPTTLTLTQAQNALATAKDALEKLYGDSQTDITNAFLDLPSILTGLQTIVTGTNTNTNLQWNIDFYLNATEVYDIKARSYRDSAYNDYLAAKKSYDTAFSGYQSMGSAPETATIEKLLADTYTTVNLASKATKSINSFVQFYTDTMNDRNLTPSPVSVTALSDLNEYLGLLSGHLATLLSDTTSLKSDKQSITEKQQSLDEVLAGTDKLDLQSAQLNVTKAQNSLTDAQNTLADYTVRAPFAGTIAKVDAEKGDQASSAASVATIITTNQIADLPLNEVDAAKITAGQKATLTFDAIDGLTIAGEVAAVDTLGTVSQGVVSYNIKVDFTTQDQRVKPGMTVNASIITDTAQNVLSVPASAVKTSGEQSYVLVFSPAFSESEIASSGSTGIVTKRIPQQIPVSLGISDDTNVQILSGVSLGQQIVTRSLTGTTAVTSSANARTGTTGTRTGAPVLFGR